MPSDHAMTTTQAAPPTPAQAFNRNVTSYAQAFLCRILGTDEGKAAAARVALSFDALARSNLEVLGCTPESVGQCVALSVMSGLAPGGPMPRVYLLPRSNRRQVNGEWTSVSELQWQIGFRGMLELATRAGYRLHAVAVYTGHEPTVDEVTGRISVPFRAIPDRSWERLEGVVVTCHRISDGAFLGYVFVDRYQIEQRREASDAYQRGISATRTEGYGRNKKEVAKTPEEMARGQSSPWFRWPEEMALKTAIRYAVARGTVPLSDDVGRVLQLEGEMDAPAVEVIEAPRASSVDRVRAALAPPPNDIPAAPEPEPVLAGLDEEEQAAIRRAEAEGR